MDYMPFSAVVSQRRQFNGRTVNVNRQTPVEERLIS
ncbi:hypothetical protein T4D_14661 [Trichinella pseudospiralis]|uniref:Uncharacterized protein n=1 Tax=Trichinella pseudospiralis TaxID=6337 RepID=A0A0V1F3M2_TRIPS|nr:hypothetical protein T4D_14661 [Trichinella pseudospiralis]